MGKINVYNKEEWIGKKYNFLTVLEAVQRKQTSGTNSWYWRCLCDCGKETVSLPRSVISGETKSCGCYKDKMIGDRRRVHGENKTPLHRTWVSMRMRCRDTKEKNYGGRGISVCSEWETYTVFRDWALSHGYKEGLSIERIDVNGNYCPENCTWITMKEQAANRRNNVYYEINGEVHTLTEWCRLYNVPYDAIHGRVRNLGWDIMEALTTPVGSGQHHHSTYFDNYEYHGKKMSLRAIAEAERVKYITLYRYVVTNGMGLDEAVAKCCKY